ncbi:hypothetical protein OG230_22430 [Streptomyces sp. NBC_00234]|uniref:hypothetical protein n=1 Tax=Streptomyces sp. NBC_00234 TaxID=2903638 RepID=UPI002E2BBCA7|nr:hypothetical protein [Streptomyces sp. NBC_00234]
MSIARRTLLTTTAAGTLLCALWFVPSANATDGNTPRDVATAGSGRSLSAVSAGESDADTSLADTGAGVDTTPYLIGGTAFLLIGAGFVTYSTRTGPVRGPSVG